MSRLKHKDLLSRGLNLLFSLAIVVLGLEELVFKPGKTVVMWTMLAFLVSGGAVFFALPLELRGPQLVNRWYRAAYWAAWPSCALAGALIIGAAVVWGITGQTPGQFTVSGILVITGMVLLVVGIVVVGGLAVAGYIAQGTEETRQWAHSLGRTNGEAESRPAQEGAPPEPA